MGYIGWRFPPLMGGPATGYINPGIENFKSTGLIDNLAREICQNSLDAKNDEISDPVRVEFKMIYPSKKDYDVFSGYEECLKGCEAYWNEDGEEEMDDHLRKFVDTAKSVLLHDKIPILVISDYCTTGLTGSKSDKKKTVWKFLTKGEGLSVKNSDDSAGSFGIGKMAPFACSSLSMVFYNTYAIDEGKAFVGVSRLATLFDENKIATHGTGHYQNNLENDWEPIFSTDECAFRDLFDREQYGTDIIVIGFNEEEDWQEKVEAAIIRNFFVAIYEGSLTAKVGDKEISKNNLGERIEYFKEQNKEFTKTFQLFQALISPDTGTPIKMKIIEDDDAELYIRSESDYDKSIATFRATGMVINVTWRNILQHYAAVFIARGKELNKVLRDTEPQRHNKWDYRNINRNENEKRKRAKEAIKTIDDGILRHLKEQYERPSGDEIDSGEGDYLPDDFDGDGVPPVSGEDILRPKTTIEKTQRQKLPQREKVASAGSDEGEKIPGEVEDPTPTPGPTPPNPPPLPRPHPVDQEEEPGKEGVSPKEGKKVIISLDLSLVRVFPISAERGLYKAIIESDSDYENVLLTFNAVGEDTNKEQLAITKYVVDGKTTKEEKTEIGPINLEKNNRKEIIIHFKKKEKMLLNLRAREVKE